LVRAAEQTRSLPTADPNRHHKHQFTSESSHVSSRARSVYSHGFRTGFNQPARISRRYSGSKHPFSSCTLPARELAFRFPSFSGSAQKLDEPFPATHGLIANSSLPLRRKLYISRPAVHPKCSQHLGRQTKPLPRFLRLGNHSIRSLSNPRPSRSTNLFPSICPSRHCYPKCFELLLPKRHRNARSSRPRPATIRRPDSVAFQHGSHMICRPDQYSRHSYVGNNSC
jgi:hypothetical protein